MLWMMYRCGGRWTKHSTNTVRHLTRFIGLLHIPYWIGAKRDPIGIGWSSGVQANTNPTTTNCSRCMWAKQWGLTLLHPTPRVHHAPVVNHLVANHLVNHLVNHLANHLAHPIACLTRHEPGVVVAAAKVAEVAEHDGQPVVHSAVAEAIVPIVQKPGSQPHRTVSVSVTLLVPLWVPLLVAVVAASTGQSTWRKNDANGPP